MTAAECYRMKTSAGTTIFISIADPSPSPPPTVLLLGPFGSTRRSVQPYISIYRSLGYHTVFTTAPLSIVFSLSQSKAAPFLLSLFRVLSADVRLLTGGLILAPIASGGGVVLPALASLLSSTPLPPAPTCVIDHAAAPPLDDDAPVVVATQTALAALVCDSCPAYPHPDLSARTLVRGLHLSARPIIAALVVLGLRILTRIYAALFGDVAAKTWNSFRDARLPCPELYIYSPEDDELDLPALQELVAYRKAKAGPCELRVVRAGDEEERESASRDGIGRRMGVPVEDYRRQMEDINYWVNAWRRREGIAEWQFPVVK